MKTKHTINPDEVLKNVVKKGARKWGSIKVRNEVEAIIRDGQMRGRFDAHALAHVLDVVNSAILDISN